MDVQTLERILPVRERNAVVLCAHHSRLDAARLLRCSADELDALLKSAQTRIEAQPAAAENGRSRRRPRGVLGGARPDLREAGEALSEHDDRDDESEGERDLLDAIASTAGVGREDVEPPPERVASTGMATRDDVLERAEARRQAILAYLREHGPSPQSEVMRAWDSTTVADSMQRKALIRCEREGGNGRMILSLLDDDEPEALDPPERPEPRDVVIEFLRLQRDAVRQRTIALQTGLSEPTVSIVVRQLADEGVVSRERDDVGWFVTLVDESPEPEPEPEPELREPEPAAPALPPGDAQGDGDDPASSTGGAVPDPAPLPAELPAPAAIGASIDVSLDALRLRYVELLLSWLEGGEHFDESLADRIERVIGLAE